MRILWKSAVFVMAFLLLTGCSSEKKEALEKAKEAYVAGDFEKAKEYFDRVQRLGGIDEKDTETVKMYQDLINKLYLKYYQEGSRYKDSKDFEKALESFEKAYNLSSHDPGLEDLIKETRQQLDAQKKLDEYMKFANSIIEQSNGLLQKFGKNIDELIIGSMKMDTFQKKVREFIPSSKQILNQLDKQLASLNGEFADIHNELVSIIEFQHNLFLSALEPNADPSVLSEQYIEAKRKQTEFIRIVQEYADSAGIKYNPISSLENTNTQESSSQ